jgi:hypothetical protein
MPYPRKRLDVIAIALAIVAGTGGALLATTSSSAGGTAPGAGEVPVAAARDPAFAASDAGAADVVAKLAAATGLPAARAATAQTWNVGGRSVRGYTSARGSFCFAFSGGTGGCLQPGTLTDERPLDVTTDYAPGTFNVYGLALDGVSAVTVHVGGRSFAAAFAHNAFTFSDGDLGGTAAVEGEAIATMSDGTTRAVPFRIGSIDMEPDQLP